jgi:hypothetical protein
MSFQPWPSAPGAPVPVPHAPRCRLSRGAYSGQALAGPLPSETGQNAAGAVNDRPTISPLIGRRSTGITPSRSSTPRHRRAWPVPCGLACDHRGLHDLLRPRAVPTQTCQASGRKNANGLIRPRRPPVEALFTGEIDRCSSRAGEPLARPSAPRPPAVERREREHRPLATIPWEPARCASTWCCPRTTFVRRSMSHRRIRSTAERIGSGPVRHVESPGRSEPEGRTRWIEAWLAQEHRTRPATAPSPPVPREDATSWRSSSCCGTRTSHHPFHGARRVRCPQPGPVVVHDGPRSAAIPVTCSGDGRPAGHAERVPDRSIGRCNADPAAWPRS